VGAVRPRVEIYTWTCGRALLCFCLVLLSYGPRPYRSVTCMPDMHSLPPLLSASQPSPLALANTQPTPPTHLNAMAQSFH